MASSSRESGPGVRRGGVQYERIHRELAKAALIEITEKGYPDYSVDDAARRAGVAIRTAYRHYDSKLALALAAIGQMRDYSGWLDGEDSCAARLRRGLAVGAAHRDYLGPMLATCLVCRRSEPALLRTLRSRVLVPRANSVERFLQEGISRGELRGDVDAASMTALDLGVLTSIAAGTLNVGRGQQRVDTLFGLIWPLIKA